MKLLLKLAWVELKLFGRDPVGLLFTFAFPLFMLFVLAGVFGNDVDETNAEDLKAWRGVGPATYYVPAYAGLVMASIGVLALPQRIASYRERGVLRRFYAAGISRLAVLGSQVLVAAVLSIVGTVLVVASAYFAHGAHLPQQWGMSLAALAIGILAFAAIGVAMGAVLPGTRAAQGAGLIVFFVMLLLSGSGPPRAVLPPGLRAMGDLLPLTHVIRLLQDPWLGFGWAWQALAVVLGFFVAALALSVRFFRWT